MRILVITFDHAPESPREWENLWAFNCYHPEYALGDFKNHDKEDFWRHMEMLRSEGIVAEYPLYLYDHSGIVLGTNRYAFPDWRWDVSSVGYAVLTKERIRKIYGVKRVTKQLIAKAGASFDAELDLYNQYLRGEVYLSSMYRLTEHAVLEAEEIIGSIYDIDDIFTSIGLDERWQEALKASSGHVPMVLMELGGKVEEVTGYDFSYDTSPRLIAERVALDTLRARKLIYVDRQILTAGGVA